MLGTGVQGRTPVTSRKCVPARSSTTVDSKRVASRIRCMKAKAQLSYRNVTPVVASTTSKRSTRLVVKAVAAPESQGVKTTQV